MHAILVNPALNDGSILYIRVDLSSYSTTQVLLYDGMGAGSKFYEAVFVGTRTDSTDTAIKEAFIVGEATSLTPATGSAKTKTQGTKTGVALTTVRD